MAKRGTFDSTQVLELVLQDSSDDKTEVDHYESSNESVEGEDFLDDVPEIDDDPDYLSDEDGEINNEMWPDTINCLNLCTLVISQGSCCLLEICINQHKTLRILRQWHEKCVRYNLELTHIIKPK